MITGLAKFILFKLFTLHERNSKEITTKQTHAHTYKKTLLKYYKKSVKFQNVVDSRNQEIDLKTFLLQMLKKIPEKYQRAMEICKKFKSSLGINLQYQARRIEHCFLYEYQNTKFSKIENKNPIKTSITIARNSITTADK